MPEPSSSPLPLSFGDEGKCKPPPRTWENEAYPTGRRSAFCGDTTLPLLASRWRIANFLELRQREDRRIHLLRGWVNKEPGDGSVLNSAPSRPNCSFRRTTARPRLPCNYLQHRSSAHAAARLAPQRAC